MNHKAKVYSLRIFHIIGALFLYFSIFILIYSGITGKKFNIINISFICISIEALAVMINKWDCPLHPVHDLLGDKKRFFGLFMPEKYTRKAMVISIALGGFSLIFYSLTKLIF